MRRRPGGRLGAEAARRRIGELRAQLLEGPPPRFTAGFEAHQHYLGVRHALEVPRIRLSKQEPGRK